MVRSTLVTAKEARRALRRRLHKNSTAWVEVLGSEIPPGPHTKNEMLELLRAKLQVHGDRGIANLVKNLLLEARNPFELDKRRLPKREVVAVSSLLAILCAALVWFNFLGR
jgi:hypothetical protein